MQIAYWAVRTEDGAVLLLGAHAEEALRAIAAMRGQQVRVTHTLDTLDTLGDPRSKSACDRPFVRVELRSVGGKGDPAPRLVRREWKV